MSFPKLMARIVGRAIRADQDMRAVWENYVREGNFGILTAACGGGGGKQIPDTPVVALFNSLVYQNGHVASALFW